METMICWEDISWEHNRKTTEPSSRREDWPQILARRCPTALDLGFIIYLSLGLFPHLEIRFRILQCPRCVVDNPSMIHMKVYDTIQIQRVIIKRLNGLQLIRNSVRPALLGPSGTDQTII